MKKTIVVILLLLLTSVWSIVFVGASTVQPLGVLPPSNKTLCSPTVLPIGGYNLVLEADTTTTFMLEYFNLQQCFPMQMAITLLQPSQPTIIRDTICAGETYTWNGNIYTRPGTYTDTLQNIYGCDSIVTLHLEVLPDPPLTFTVNGVSFKMMRVRAGSFIMGALDDDTEAEANERPAHLVTLTRDYFVSETVLTQELWTAVMGTTIQEEEEKRTSGNETNLGYGPNFPMYCLSHKDCQKFVERLNQLTGLTFRMPTEAEWEYAARGGHLSRGYKYPGSNNPSEVAWSIANDPQRKLHPVKLLKPNELGLYDMAGNVWEYIYDYHRTYTTAAQIDPLGDTITNKANIRGGSTAWGTTCSRTSYRHQQSNITKESKDGRRTFRFVLDADRVIGEDNTTYQAFDTICAGETYTWNGKTYTKPGSYTDTLQNIYGCDSIVTLHLEVLPDPPMTFTVNGVSFKMMRVRAGTFMMGATDDDTEAEANEYPAHEVTLTRDYFIAETMLTQELWTAVMGTTAQEEEMGTSGMTGLGYGDDYPMYPLSYYDCQAFVDSLSKLTGLTFRMPTEAEWEYAARGGHLSRGYKYPGSNDPDEVAWTYVTIPDQTIRPVKQLLPNELGLYDMAGNVWEWVLDYNRQYTATPQVDPIGDLDTTMAFVRGGSTYFRYEYKHIRVSSRGDEFAKTYKNTRMGFRFVLDAKGVLENNQIYLIRDTICAGETYTWNGNTYTKPGTYTDTLQNIYGCDSIVTMHLQVNPTYEVHDTVVACDSYEWHGEEYHNSGIYYDSLLTIHGCDSVEILHLTINNSSTQEYHITSCVSYTWKEDKTYTQSGVYYDSLLTINGCDSVEILYLIILPPTEHFVTDTLLCHGITYTWRDSVYTTAGTYNDTVRNMLLCDSIIYTLNLQYLPDVVYVEEDTLLCHGVTCEWRNKQYTTAGSYNDTVRNMLQCDSIIYTLNLQYLPDVVYVKEDTLLCHGVTCEWRNKPYTTAGTYHDTIRNMLLCDSIIYTLNLQYLPDVVYVEEDTLLCHGVTCEWRNKQYTTAGAYNDTVRNMLLCDSIIYTLYLQYLPDVVYVEEDTLLCHGVTCEWRNKPYTTAGTYNDTVRNQLLCDSIIYTLELSYLPEVQHFTTDTAICYGFACTWRDYTYDVSGTYHDTIRNILHCDSIIYTLNLLIHPEIPITHVTDTMAGPEYHWNEQIYTTGGEYSVILPAVTGCDSTVVLHLLSNPAAIDTVILYEQCAGSGEQEIEILTQGFISQIAFRYSPKALAAGWQDTIMPFASDDLYTLSYRDMRAGIYEATAVGLFHDVEVATYSFTLTYLYPTTIFEQRYNDLITVLTHDYNGGYDFVAFQWYKDGVLIPGATHSYLNQSLGFEAEYSVLLTDTNGLALMSCPIIAEDKAELSVYPTILQPGGSAKVSITESNVLYIHDSTGKIIQEHHLEQGITDISMPIVSGVYLLRFVSNDHIERTFKLIVQ